MSRRLSVPPESAGASTSLVERLDAVHRRLLAAHVLRAVSSSAAVAALSLAILGLTAQDNRLLVPVIAVALVGVFAIVFAGRRSRTRAAAARAVERAVPSCRNVVVTAEELLDHPERASPWMRERVYADAAARVRSASTTAIVPLGRPAGAAVLLLGVAVLAGALPSSTGQPVSEHAAAGASSPQAEGIRIQIQLTPPAYSGLKSEVLENRDVVALEGTHARLTLTGDVNGWRVRFGQRPLPVRVEARGAIAELDLTEDGYFAIEPREQASEPTRLIAVRLVPDRAPSVRIERPARDLLLPESQRTVDIGAVASDDFALNALSLRYTKVSGAGEQFEFVEGEIPVDILRDTPASWRAHGRIPIARLGLEPGDSLVYRVTARDRRPGRTGESSSDTFFIEIAGPGQIPLEGFEMPPEQERYALSQQMIVVKIQRLRARQAAMSRQALHAATAAIAAEQRSVRANFVFLMGGHVEDEEEEAEHSNEIQEGRLENTARREISRAVSHMSATEQGLMSADTRVALERGRLAVAALQRAFGRSRYILRTLPVHSRIDPSRRLSGALDDARDAERGGTPATEEPGTATARALLTEMLTTAAELRAAPGSSRAVTRLTAAAERALSLKGAGTEWQQIAGQLLQLRDAAAGGTPEGEVDKRLAAIVSALVARVRAGALETLAPHGPQDRLRSAWAGEARR
jgi:hypothetical protein